MGNSETKVAIIGAGISGLTAACRLEKEGWQVTLFDQNAHVGGRLVTDTQGDYILDRGFQVLLTSYPEAQKYLDYKRLELFLFRPGARVYKGGKSHVLGDPTRRLNFLFATLFFPFASLKDKWKVFQLNTALRSKSIEAIFETPETTTLEYLKDKGFSKKIIDHFFKPFYGGIFLESELETSSRMFEFVFKMFGDGHAALPLKGIQQIPEQLKGQLKTTQVKLNCRIQQQEGDQLIWIDQAGDTFQESFDKVIYAGASVTDLGNRYPNQDQQGWHSCNNFYFEYLDGKLEEGLIGLIADPNALINNIHLVPSLDGKPSQLLSVTLLGSPEVESTIQAEAIRSELRRLCGIEAGKLIAHYVIKKALPVLEEFKYNLPPESYTVNQGQFVAGDYLLYPSLNAAMHSGEAAAEACIRSAH